tara:strand:+ start:665 stop:1432 length:768 start_codon:yes stop_codon:yes gene_type:complete
MINILKYIDRNFLNNSIGKIWFSIRSFYAINFLLTSLPKNVNKEFRLKARFDFFKRAQYYLQVNRIDGVYAEFGSHEVNTFRMSLQTLGLPFRPNRISKFYSFDSFQGMPEPEGIDKQKIWRKSMNFTSKEKFLKITKRDSHRVVAVKGFYEHSLPNYKWPKEDIIALAYIDCDYYESTKECLNFIKDKLQHGALIAFDDWDCYYSDYQRGQKKAFSEFKELLHEKNSFVEFSDIATGGRCFIILENNKIGKIIE